ncbi:MAG: SAM-dependent methyltransferase, partial [Alphaproteobacteria bacterium]
MAGYSTRIMAEPMHVFDRALLRRRRARAAARLDAHDFLFRAGAERLADRLDDMRGGFARVLELGAHGALLRDAIGARAGGEAYVAAD